MELYILDVEQFKESEYGKDIPKQKIHHQAGRYLLCLALGEENYVRAKFAVGEHGKPYIVGEPIHYNISHSGQYVVLVTGKSEIGVDIQECKAVKAESLAKRFFTKQEQEVIYVSDLGEDGKKAREEQVFYKIWCRKEAYGKYLGVGLNEQVLHTNVLSAGLKDCKFHDFDSIEGYQISICSRKGEHIEKIIRVFEGL